MKTMYGKTLILLVGLLIYSSSVFAQRTKIHENPKYGPDSASRMECASNLSIMNQYVKIKTFEYAIDSWRFCFKNCPEASKNIYIHGSRIIKYIIENEEDQAIADSWVDTLMILYDQRMEYFNEEGKVYGIKGIDLLRYRKESIETAYTYLEKSVNLSQEKVDESVAVTFISTTYALFQNQKVGADVMINNYVTIMDIMNKKLASGDKDPKIPQAIESIEKMFAESGAADCDALIEIFSVKFEESPEDIELLKKITTLLGETGCEESDLYAKSAEALYGLEPSADAAAKLANVFVVRSDYTKAKNYYNNAIDQETDAAIKAKYYFYLSGIYYQEKDYPNTRNKCLAALNLNPAYGEAYILIGKAYAASSKNCGESDFEKQAVYWAAVDKFIKAKSVDPSIKEEADNQINSYSQYFPNNEITFFNGYTDGQTYKVGCWIQETTTVRTTKN
jgi:tetratricopeptide (TPR) repeat protein